MRSMGPAGPEPRVVSNDIVVAFAWGAAGLRSASGVHRRRSVRNIVVVRGSIIVDSNTGVYKFVG